MEIVLTAFNKKLMSKVLDFPDNTTQTIYLELDCDMNETIEYRKRKTFVSPEKIRCTFRVTGKKINIGQKSGIEYKLVDINK